MNAGCFLFSVAAVAATPLLMIVFILEISMRSRSICSFMCSDIFNISLNILDSTSIDESVNIVREALHGSRCSTSPWATAMMFLPTPLSIISFTSATADSLRHSSHRDSRCSSDPCTLHCTTSSSPSSFTTGGDIFLKYSRLTCVTGRHLQVCRIRLPLSIVIPHIGAPHHPFLCFLSIKNMSTRHIIIIKRPNNVSWNRCPSSSWIQRVRCPGWVNFPLVFIQMSCNVGAASSDRSLNGSSLTQRFEKRFFLTLPSIYGSYPVAQSGTRWTSFPVFVWSHSPRTFPPALSVASSRSIELPDFPGACLAEKVLVSAGLLFSSSSPPLAVTLRICNVQSFALLYLFGSSYCSLVNVFRKGKQLPMDLGIVCVRRCACDQMYALLIDVKNKINDYFSTFPFFGLKYQ